MEAWVIYENNCYEYLCEHFKDIALNENDLQAAANGEEIDTYKVALITHMGGSDRYRSDIAISFLIPNESYELPLYLDRTSPIIIECKMPYRARYGQRVIEENGNTKLVEAEVDVDSNGGYVLKNNDSYAFSRLVDYINSKQDLGDESLEDEETDPEELFYDGDESEQAFLAEIASGYYQEKNVDALMTGRKSGAGYCIVPVDANDLAYLVSFSYGIRDYRSGSSPCSLQDEETIRNILVNNYGIDENDIDRVRAYYRGGKYKSRLIIYNRDYYENNRNIHTNDTFSISGNYEYKLRERDELYTEDGMMIDDAWEVIRRSPNSSLTLFLIGSMKQDSDVGNEFIRQSIMDFDYFVDSDWSDEIYCPEDIAALNGSALFD